MLLLLEPHSKEQKYNSLQNLGQKFNNGTLTLHLINVSAVFLSKIIWMRQVFF